MFDFDNKEKKAKYYARAQAFLQENEIECFVIDKDRFGIKQNTYVRIDLEPFSKKTVSKDELCRAKQLKPFVVINDRFTRNRLMQGTSIRETAYLLFEIDEEDK